MEFKEFKKLLQDHVEIILKDNSVLFVTDTDKEELWNTYLDSFPPGTNELFRERREFDCSCCRHFIKSIGNVVLIKDNDLVSIWDFKADDTFQPVIDALSLYVKSKPIRDVFITKESRFGTDKSHEQLESGEIRTWEHFIIKLPKQFVSKSTKTEASLVGEYRDIKNVFKRSLEEISEDSIETVLDLISQNSIYKGMEWEKVLKQFLSLHKEYHKTSNKNLFCWKKAGEVGGAVGKIRNHSIGTLLTDITNGVELNEALRKYEVIVAPTNYKRPKAIFTKKMIEQAQQTLNDLGLLDSLERRFAVIDDITVNNILFANRDTLKKMTGDVFAELEKEVVSKKKFDHIEEVQIDDFINNILPRLTNFEVLFENKHTSNLVSLIAPKIKESKSMFKWNNNFSWAYNGNITDSMKQRVKAAGGNVEGVLRFSLQWNEDGDNRNDFDAHCIEPNKNHIYFPNKRIKHPSSGMLDVDIVHPQSNQVAVENITWTDKNRMKEGIYKLFVHNFSHRGGRSGFSAEIEYDGQIYSFDYNKELKHGENVVVAEIKFTRKEGIKFIKSLPSSTMSRTVWGIQTNQFNPVSICMFSPNYWDSQINIGHKHYFFIVNNCRNEDKPNGFFNEFLREDLMKHKRVFEALGSKMKVEDSENQLSGLGFSSTKRDSLVCKLEGHTNRTIKLLF